MTWGFCVMFAMVVLSWPWPWAWMRRQSMDWLWEWMTWEFWHCITREKQMGQTRKIQTLSCDFLKILKTIFIYFVLFCWDETDWKPVSSPTKVLFFLLCFALFCFALLCFALLCFASLRFASLRFASLRFISLHFASFRFVLFCFVSLCFGLFPIGDEHLIKWKKKTVLVSADYNSFLLFK